MEGNSSQPLNLLDEVVLRKYIKDVVRHTLNEMLLNEMAFELGAYKERIRNHAPEIARNWCLVRYTAYDEMYLKLRGHWMAELKAHLNELAIAKVATKRQYDTKYKAVLAVWAEYEFDRDEYSIDGQIANKFEEEGIDRTSEAYIQTIDDFKNATKDIATVISNSERAKVNEYVNNLCNLIKN